MSRTWAVVKREFGAFVGTKWFLVGTLFGPLALLALLALPAILERHNGGDRIAVVDATGTAVGREIAASLAEPGAGGDRSAGLRVEVVRATEKEAPAVQARLRDRALAGEIDGFVVLPDAAAADAPVLYEGRGAGHLEAQERLHAAVERAIHRERLTAAGIDPAAVERALAPVRFETRSLETGPGEGEPSPHLLSLVFYLNTAIYMVILIYGLTVLRSVQEEKEQRIVEVLLSSLEPRQLMAGKVLGIGVAGLLQVSIWLAFGVALLTWGDDVLLRLGVEAPSLPHVPAGLVLVLLVFFGGGYFLYASLYAAFGAVATSWQEAQNLQFPVLFVLMVSFFMTFAAVDDPDGPIALVTTFVPFTAPLVVPSRVALAAASWSEVAVAAVILVASCLAVLWLAGAIFRVTILATGSRPSARQIWRWMRAA